MITSIYIQIADVDISNQDSIVKNKQKKLLFVIFAKQSIPSTKQRVNYLLINNMNIYYSLTALGKQSGKK